jgi:hypothetical protein
MGAFQENNLKTWRRFLAVIPILLFGSSGWSWNRIGHQVICDIALRELKPHTRKVVEAILHRTSASESLDFVGAGSWADDHRDRSSGSWHYINLHFRSDGLSTQSLPAHQNVVWAINMFSDVIKGRNSNAVDQREALLYLIHFVSDVHQPLHCVSRDSNRYPDGDRGGNSFAIQSAGIPGNPKNLHSLWDSGCGLFCRGCSVHSLASNLLKAHPIDPKLVKISDANTWAKEGLLVAKTTAYNIVEGALPNSMYLERCRSVSAKRVVLAGKRLAALLNRIIR